MAAAVIECEQLSVDSILKNVKDLFSKDPSSTREQIAMLDEPSLRRLRDQLLSQLVEVIPAIAGRPMNAW